MATELENLVPEADVEVEGMRGPKGDKGDSYVLTEADKEEIARKVDTIIDAETDKTLSISGKPADAKAVGDEINNLKADLSEIEDSVGDLYYEAPYYYEFASDFSNSGKINTDGTVAVNSSRKYSDLIMVDKEAKIEGLMIAGSNIVALACYDENENFVSEPSIVNQFSGSFIVPQGVKYVRFCFWTSYPSCWFTINNGAYKHGLNKCIDYHSNQLEIINSDLFTSVDTNTKIEPITMVNGYTVSDSGIVEAASNWALYAFKVQRGLVGLVSNHRSVIQTDWKFALFDAETYDECNANTIIGKARFYNKNVRNSFLISQDCILCVSTHNNANSASAYQESIIYPISGYTQKQIGTLSNLNTQSKDNLVNAINEIENVLFPRLKIYGTPISSPHYFRINAIDGCWLLVHHNSLVTLYNSNGEVVQNLGAVSMRGTHKPRLYCDGTWSYAEVYEGGDLAPMIVQDASLFLGDSYIGLGDAAIGEQFGLQYLSSHWAHGHGGYTAKQIVDMVTGIPGIVSDYDSDYITGWKEGKFARVFLYCGANLISYGDASNVETLAQNSVEGNIPTGVVGSISDLLAGNTITVNGQTISSISDYYALFGNTTIGQYAFLIEYLQAVHKGPIYLMGYVPWSTLVGREKLISTVCKELEILYGVNFINTFISTGYSIRNSTEILYDGIHLSRNGYKIYVENMLKQYKSLIE